MPVAMTASPRAAEWPCASLVGMKTRLFHLLDRFRSSYWFLPSLLSILAGAAAVAAVRVDVALADVPLGSFTWIRTAGAEGARAVLGTVAGSMITIAGVVFSITIVALSLASSQFGPRLLANFMRDRGNQLVLGTFIATFIYCLVVLRSVSAVEERTFVPHFSVMIAVGLAFASVGVLIYFMHHASTSIQAAHVISLVGEDLDEVVRKYFPERNGERDAEPPGAGEPPDGFREASEPVAATGGGYVQTIDLEGLTELASKHGLVVRLLRRQGQFVTAGSPLALVAPAPESDDAGDLGRKINHAFLYGDERTVSEDPEFAIEQLVEVAVRALSPGVNDPFTAVRCIDRLGASLGLIARRRLPSFCRLDPDGNPRVYERRLNYSGICEAAFNQIRQYGGSSVAVTLRLLECIAALAPQVEDESFRDALRRQADVVRSAAGRGESWSESDLADLAERHGAALEALRDGTRAIEVPSGVSP